MIFSSASTTELHVSMPQLPEVSAVELLIQPISTINLQADRIVEALTTSSAGSVAASVNNTKMVHNFTTYKLYIISRSLLYFWEQNCFISSSW